MGHETYVPAPLSVAVDADDRRNVVVRVRGELDLATTAVLHDAVLATLVAHPPRVVLDLSRVTFIDCSGLTELLALQRSCGTTGSALVLGTVSPTVRDLLVLCELAEQFPGDDRIPQRSSLDEVVGTTTDR
jgi:anti-anti-sigma factor